MTVPQSGTGSRFRTVESQDGGMQWLDNTLIRGKLRAWGRLQDGLGYRFGDLRLLATAMCHRSFANENPGLRLEDNERLEFLGDAVLDLVVAQMLVGDYSDQREGELTRMRAEAVAESGLAALANGIGLGECLLLGRGEMRSGGQRKASLLADALEALFGAIFQEAGYEKVAAVLSPLFDPLLQRAAGHAGQDFKTRLQELVQARRLALPIYRLVEETGPDHERLYQVEVLISGRVFGSGQGPTKKKAEQVAAGLALAELDAG